MQLNTFGWVTCNQQDHTCSWLYHWHTAHPPHTLQPPHTHASPASKPPSSGQPPSSKHTHSHTTGAPAHAPTTRPVPAVGLLACLWSHPPARRPAGPTQEYLDAIGALPPTANTPVNGAALQQEHRRDPRRSKLKRIVPTVGSFFTPLRLVEAFKEYDAVFHLSRRKYIPPNFAELRHILNLAQLHASAGEGPGRGREGRGWEEERDRGGQRGMKQERSCTPQQVWGQEGPGGGGGRGYRREGGWKEQQISSPVLHPPRPGPPGLCQAPAHAPITPPPPLGPPLALTHPFH